MSAAPNDSILVNIQYRHGGFRFLAGPEVAECGALNAGLLDQRLAIEWVQRHISIFGGEPQKIIIQGGSACGGSVLYQMIWQGGEAAPPFRAGIVESPYVPDVLNASAQETQYNAILTAANCTDLAYLRSLNTTAPRMPYRLHLSRPVSIPRDSSTTRQPSTASTSPNCPSQRSRTVTLPKYLS